MGRHRTGQCAAVGKWLKEDARATQWVACGTQHRVKILAG